MQLPISLLLLIPLALGEQMERLLETLPAEVLSGLVAADPILAVAGLEAGNLLRSTLKDVGSTGLGSSGGKFLEEGKALVEPLKNELEGFAEVKAGKAIKTTVPLKKVAVKKAVGAKVLVPKVKVAAALKKKPQVYHLKPIVHIVEKSVPVYHKVPVPKKVLVPKFYPVYKPIPVPKIVPVPFKVPIKKIIPKIVKIPKAIPVPKFVPVKKPIPIGIPYPVPKIYKVPIPKPVPYAKFIPIPVPKKVPKFIPVPVKKIIKVPKPYYVPVKIPHITTSYVKTPMKVKVPDAKKKKFKGEIKGFEDSFMNFIPSEEEDIFKMKDANSVKMAGNPLKMF